MLLNRCVNPEDEEGPGDIFQIQHSLQVSLIEYVYNIKFFVLLQVSVLISKYCLMKNIQPAYKV